LEYVLGLISAMVVANTGYPMEALWLMLLSLEDQHKQLSKRLGLEPTTLGFFGYLLPHYVVP
jgi:hypothetical protein